MIKSNSKGYKLQHSWGEVTLDLSSPNYFMGKHPAPINPK